MAKSAAAKTWALPLRSDGQRYSLAPISAPTAIARTVDSPTQITLQASGGASALGSNTGYRYRRGGVLLNSNATASAFVDTGLSSNVTYLYTATLVDSAGNESDWSATFSATTPVGTDVTPPTTPVIAAAGLSASTIRVSIVTPSTDAGSGLRDYTLQTSISSSGPWTDLLTGVQAASFPYTHSGLSANVTRFYRLVATDVALNQAISAIVSATTLASGGAGTINLSWNAPTQMEDGTAVANLAGFILQAGAYKGDVRVQITLLQPSATNYQWSDPAFVSGSTWYLRVIGLTTSGAQSLPSADVIKAVP